MLIYPLGEQSEKKNPEPDRFRIQLDKRVAHKDDSGTFLARKNEGGREGEKRMRGYIWLPRGADRVAIPR